MANGWTPERRARQAELIRGWKPWERSTGPKTTQGKARVSRNAYRGGVRPMLRELAKALRDQRDELDAF
jgi:hypothetical protein